MDILRKSGNLFINPSDVPSNGVVFLYANWSESKVYLKYLGSLLNHYPLIELYVYDIDELLVHGFMNKHNVICHGWGETFWLFEGEIISQVLHYKKEGTSAVEFNEHLNKLILNIDGDNGLQCL